MGAFVKVFVPLVSSLATAAAAGKWNGLAQVRMTLATESVGTVTVWSNLARDR
jgi:hypothetical protein